MSVTWKRASAGPSTTGARLLVLPSFDEGFGLPAVEAMAAGVPVVASRRGALPEVCGDAAVYVDPDDAAGMAATVAELLASPERLEALRQRGRRAGSPVLVDGVGATAVAGLCRCHASAEGALMRIGVDARELGGRPTGVGRYLRELLLRWQASPACAGADLVLFSAARQPGDRADIRQYGGAPALGESGRRRRHAVGTA